MKYFVLTAAGIVVSISMVVVSQWQISRQKSDPHTEWKRLAVEPETKVRPDRFEAMKWAPEQVELRAPASAKKPAKK